MIEPDSAGQGKYVKKSALKMSVFFRDTHICYFDCCTEMSMYYESSSDECEDLPALDISIPERCFEASSFKKFDVGKFTDSIEKLIKARKLKAEKDKILEREVDENSNSEWSVDSSWNRNQLGIEDPKITLIRGSIRNSSPSELRLKRNLLGLQELDTYTDLQQGDKIQCSPSKKMMILEQKDKGSKPDDISSSSSSSFSLEQQPSTSKSMSDAPVLDESKLKMKTMDVEL